MRAPGLTREPGSPALARLGRRLKYVEVGVGGNGADAAGPVFKNRGWDEGLSGTRFVSDAPFEPRARRK